MSERLSKVDGKEVEVEGSYWKWNIDIVIAYFDCFNVCYQSLSAVRLSNRI